MWISVTRFYRPDGFPDYQPTVSEHRTKFKALKPEPGRVSDWPYPFFIHRLNLNLNLMRQRIQVIQLMITGKKAIAYIYPLLSLRWRSNFRLKPANEHPEIISSSKIFHSFTTLLLNENLATANLTLFLFNFNEWPRRLDCDISKKHFWINILISFENFKNFYYISSQLNS